ENDFALSPDQEWNWSNDLKLGGGHLNLVGGHFIDISQWLFGPIKQIRKSNFRIAKNARRTRESLLKAVTADDLAHLNLEFNDNLTGKIVVSQMSKGKNEMIFLIEGNKGSIKIDSQNKLFLKNKQGNDFSEIPVSNETKSIFTGSDNNLFTIGTYYLGKSIIDHLNGFKREFPTLKDALNNQKIIEKAYQTLG
ncbi:Gfo/Idh/MocA family oxidoreductase, partial [Xanthovirga aplysinae]|uniref:Gfo/Idh/MocA family oxidoreductase n=1 Tax=Xanthovirga aplysinae TaxID=2529853 RepID=UPI0016572501